MCGRVCGDRPVVEVGTAEVAVQPLEQAHEVGSVRPVDGRESAERPRDRQIGSDGGDMQDRARLEVEGGGLLAEVGDL
jgi:hypothetical protein